MRSTAALLAALVLLTAGCHRRPPAARPPEIRSALVAEFTAITSGPAGRLRLSGLLAVASGGRIRAEIAAPTVATPFLLVADGERLTAALVADRLHVAAKPDEALLARLAGVAVEPGWIARVVTGEAPADPEGCAARVGRFRSGPDGLPIPTKVSVRCGESGLTLHLRSTRPLDAGGRDPFAPLELPPGWSEGGLEDLARAVEAVARGS